jgi:hypothetical protein
MRDTGGSETALGAALLRAVYHVLDPQPRWIEDPLAVGFIPGSSAEEIAARREVPNAEVWRVVLQICTCIERYARVILSRERSHNDPHSRAVSLLSESASDQGR